MIQPRPTQRVLATSAMQSAGMVAIALWLAACSGAHSYERSVERAQPIPVKVDAVRTATLAGSVKALAALEADRDTMVVARAGGQVTALAVEEGDTVSAGQLLLQLDDKEAKMALQQAEATLQKLQRAWQRASNLSERQLVSQEAYDQARYAFESQVATVALLRADLADTEIRAPFAGVIAERLVNTGEVLMPLQAAFRLIDPASIQAVIHVPEGQLGSIQAGLPATVTLTANAGRRFDAVVHRVAPRVDHKAGTGRVVIAFDDASDLRPGQYGTIEIKTAERPNALVIATQSVVLEGQQSYVYVIDAAGQAERKAVTLGQQVDATHVEVLFGLSVHDRVVSEGHNRLDTGSIVREV